MTDDVPYDYTDRDLLADPETYEYSEVLGAPFLGAYFDDRSECLTRLEKRLDEFNARAGGTSNRWTGLLESLSWAATDSVGPHLPTHGASDGWPDIDIPNAVPSLSADRVETIPSLAALLGYPGDRPPTDEAATAWLDRYVKRFEVSKRLYVSYDGTMSAVDNQLAPAAAYPMLALACLVNYNRTSNLKHLNTALKLCDLLSSRTEALESQGTIALARLALDEERGAILALVDTLEVSL